MNIKEKNDKDLKLKFRIVWYVNIFLFIIMIFLTILIIRESNLMIEKSLEEDGTEYHDDPEYLMRQQSFLGLVMAFVILSLVYYLFLLMSLHFFYYKLFIVDVENKK